MLSIYLSNIYLVAIYLISNIYYLLSIICSPFLLHIYYILLLQKRQLFFALF
nr:MAG TPA: hypothetical protein [Caudoviricetes sp.]